MKKIVEEKLKEIAQRCNEARGGSWTAFIEGRYFTGGSDVIKIGTVEANHEDLYLVGYRSKSSCC